MYRDDLPEVAEGVTLPPLTREPLGLESEMTPGPNDWNPYEEDVEPKEVDKEQLDREFKERGFTAEEDVDDLPFWDQSEPNAFPEPPTLSQDAPFALSLDPDLPEW